MMPSWIHGILVTISELFTTMMAVPTLQFVDGSLMSSAESASHVMAATVVVPSLASYPFPDLHHSCHEF